MTLQRFLNAVGDSRWTWIGRQRWKPHPTARFGWTAWLVQALSVGAFTVILASVFAVVVLRVILWKSGWGPWAWMAGLGALAGALIFAKVAVAWNRRAAQLAAAGLTEPPPLPRLRWWQRWIVAPVYILVLFMLTPLAVWLAIDGAIGTMAWNHTRAELAARGEPLTLDQLRPPAPPADQNFAMTPLIRSGWDYETGVTNGKTELIWKDPVGRLRLEALSVPQSFRPHLPTKSGRELRDSRIQLDWIARSIRSKPLRRPEGLPDDLARRYGMVATNPPSMPEKEVLALPIADPAAEVLAYLQRFEPELNEISSAARRPRSRFEVRWDNDGMVLLPALAHLKALSVTFRIRAAAKLQKGDVDGAFADTLTTFRVADTLAEDPFLISFLVRVAQTALATSTAWQGLASHQWTEAQLAELQSIFGKIDFRQPLIQAFRGERVMGNQMYEAMLAGSIPNASADPDGPVNLGFANAPRGNSKVRSIAMSGMIRWNQVHQERFFTAIIAQIQEPSWPRMLAGGEVTEAFLRRLGLRPMNPHNAIAGMLVPAFDKAQAKAARQNVTARLAEVACALERHRLRTGSYPENLESLVPRYLKSLPLDPMTDQTLPYERTDDGWFRLWSVGLNGRDDGGVMNPKDNDAKGDWVWPTPVPTTDLLLF